MSSVITINFTNTTLTSGTAPISVQGATFVLDPSNPVTVSGTVPFNSFTMYEALLNFNVAAGTVVTATVTVPVDVPSGTPTITIANFSGYVQVSWPVTSGPPSSQVASPSDPVPLVNIPTDN